MSSFAKHRWSTASIGLSLVGLAGTFLAVLHFRGQGDMAPESLPDVLLGVVDGCVMVGSFVLAVVSLFREKSPRRGLVALGLSLLSIFFYAR